MSRQSDAYQKAGKGAKRVQHEFVSAHGGVEAGWSTSELNTSSAVPHISHIARSCVEMCIDWLWVGCKDDR